MNCPNQQAEEDFDNVFFTWLDEGKISEGFYNKIRHAYCYDGDLAQKNLRDIFCGLELDLAKAIQSKKQACITGLNSKLRETRFTQKITAKCDKIRSKKDFIKACLETITSSKKGVHKTDWRGCSDFPDWQYRLEVDDNDFVITVILQIGHTYGIQATRTITVYRRNNGILACHIRMRDRYINDLSPREITIAKAYFKYIGSKYPVIRSTRS
jgi:hypothetical protein